MKITNHDATTGETVEVELSAKDAKAIQDALAAETALMEAQKAAIAEAKAALLEKLGITAEEAKLLA